MAILPSDMKYYSADLVRKHMRTDRIPLERSIRNPVPNNFEQIGLSFITTNISFNSRKTRHGDEEFRSHIRSRITRDLSQIIGEDFEKYVVVQHRESYNGEHVIEANMGVLSATSGGNSFAALDESYNDGVSNALQVMRDELAKMGIPEDDIEKVTVTVEDKSRSYKNSVTDTLKHLRATQAPIRNSREEYEYTYDITGGRHGFMR